MIIAGAGGHGLEVYSLLVSAGYNSDFIYFFDEDVTKKESFIYRDKVITDHRLLEREIQTDQRFCLGVGSPIFRKKFLGMLTELGGKHFPVNAKSAIDQSEKEGSADLMEFAFVGPQVQLGESVLINTRASIHHECQVGDFTEIGPGAMLLGGVKAGKMCRIGAGAVILPGIELGDEVTVGAGAVVTRSMLEKGIVLKGVPAKSY